MGSASICVGRVDAGGGDGTGGSAGVGGSSVCAGGGEGARGGETRMIDRQWTAEDAAVSADSAMDHGVFAAELWGYCSPAFVQQLVCCPPLFSVWAGVQNSFWGRSKVWSGAWTRVRSDARVGMASGRRAAARARISIWSRPRVRVGREVRIAAVLYVGDEPA